MLEDREVGIRSLVRVVEAPRDPLAQGSVLRHKIDNDERDTQLVRQVTEEPPLPALQKRGIDDHPETGRRRISSQLQRLQIGLPCRLGRVKARFNPGTIACGGGQAVQAFALDVGPDAHRADHLQQRLR